MRDYVAEYFAYSALAPDIKRPSTLETERAHLNAWRKHYGNVRLHHLNRAMVNRFIALRQTEGASPPHRELGDHLPARRTARPRPFGNRCAWPGWQ